MVWETLVRPGFLGKKRNELYETLNSEYTPGNWRLAWQWGNIFVTLPFVAQIYEMAYYEHFKKNPEVLEKLLTYSDVYVNNISDRLSGHDYTKQTSIITHLHDIAIRKAVMLSGRDFKSNENILNSNGKDLLKVSWDEPSDSFGYQLNPGAVPFYRPEMILDGNGVKDYGGETKRNPGSIDAFYQFNKVIQIRVN